MVRKSFIGTGIIAGVLALGTYFFKTNIDDRPEYTLHVGQDRTLFQDGWHEYTKEFGVRSEAVSDDAYVMLMVGTQGYKNGKPVEGVQDYCQVQVRPPKYWTPQLVANCLPDDLMYPGRIKRIKPDAIDEVVLTFSPYYPENIHARLPAALKLPITPGLIDAYKDDLLSEKIMNEDRLRESTLKTGVSSGRW